MACQPELGVDRDGPPSAFAVRFGGQVARRGYGGQPSRDMRAKVGLPAEALGSTETARLRRFAATARHQPSPDMRAKVGGGAGFGLAEHTHSQQLTAKDVVSILSIPSNGRDQVQNRYSDPFGGGVRSSSPPYMPLNDLQASVAGAAVTADMRRASMTTSIAVPLPNRTGWRATTARFRFCLRCSRSRLTS